MKKLFDNRNLKDFDFPFLIEFLDIIDNTRSQEMKSLTAAIEGFEFLQRIMLPIYLI